MYTLREEKTAGSEQRKESIRLKCFFPTRERKYRHFVWTVVVVFGAQVGKSVGTAAVINELSYSVNGR